MYQSKPIYSAWKQIPTNSDIDILKAYTCMSIITIVEFDLKREYLLIHIVEVDF